MEKQHYHLILSLKQLSLRRIAVSLWSLADILLLIKSFPVHKRTDYSTIRQWQESVESKVKEKVPMLLLPHILLEDLICVIKPIGPEILKWKMHYESVTSNPCPTLNILNQLCWTSLGTVDYKKTAEILIRQEQIDLKSSYILACLYCMEDDIRTFWEKLPKETKRLFYDCVTPLDIRQPELVIIWTYIIKGKVSELDSLIHQRGRPSTLYQFAFASASLSGNKVASEYFLKKLTFEEREVSLVQTMQRLLKKGSPYLFRNHFDFPREKFCDVICYLLSQMTGEEQEFVFQNLHHRILRYFMDWPWQDLFMEVAELMWNKNILTHVQYYTFIRIFARNQTMTRYNYAELFRELFLNAPRCYRNYIISKHLKYGQWFRDLFYSHNTEMIKVVLRNLDDKDRTRFIICKTGCLLCIKFIDEERWDWLEVFVKECRLSSRDAVSLKISFMSRVMRYCKSMMKQEKRKFDKFIQLIDNAVVNSDNKRIADAEQEEVSTSVE